MSLEKVEKLARTNITGSLKEIKGRAVYLWGTGGLSEITTKILKELNIEIAGYVDSNPSKTGQYFNDKEIIAPIGIKDKNSQIFVFVATTYIDEVTNSLFLLKYTAKDRCLVSLDFQRSLQMELTTRCNLNCSFCGFRHMENKEMSVEEAKNIIDTAESALIESIYFSGRGENLLHPDYSEILRYASGKFKFIQIINNALCMTDDIADTILSMDDDINVRFSVTGFSSEVYNRFQGNGCGSSALRDKAYSNILQYLEKKSAAKSQSKADLIYLLEDSSIDSISDFKKYVDFWEDKADDIIVSTVNGAIDTDPIDASLKRSLQRRCDLYGDLFVHYDGSVVLCCLPEPDKLGNINDQPLDAALSSKKYTQFRRSMMHENFSDLPVYCQKCYRLYDNLYTRFTFYSDIKVFLPKMLELEHIAKSSDLTLLGIGKNMAAFIRAMYISETCTDKSIYDLYMAGGSYERLPILAPTAKNLAGKTVIVFDDLQKELLIDSGDFKNVRFIDYRGFCS